MALLLPCLAILASAAAVDASRGDSYDASFLVDTQAGESPGLVLGLDFADRGPPGRVTLYVPRGFEIVPERPLAFPVGVAEMEAGSSSYGSFSDATLVGQITGLNLDSPLAAAAQACAPSPAYIALWKLSLTLLGQPVDVPISIAPIEPGDPTDSDLRIDFCPPAVSGPAGSPAVVLPMQAFGVLLSFVEPPRYPGSYVWHAVVTPVGPDGHSLLPDRAYELRSTFPVPHVLTLSGRRSGRFAVLTGKLTAAGAPEPHQLVVITRLVRKVVHGRVEVDDTIAGLQKTDSHGAYRLRVPLPVKAGFYAETGGGTEPCSPPAFASLGCVSATVPGTVSRSITVNVPPTKR